MDDPVALMPGPLLSWYRKNARILPWRENTDPYRVWISEIMLQQTRVETVKPYFLRFLDAFPTVQTLADAPEDLLLKLWEGLGYYSRARNLQKTAQRICRDFGGIFPNRYEQLRTLPGIGPYTAGAICSIAFGQPEPAVDGNVLRVLSRLTACPQSIADKAVSGEFTERLRAVYPAGQCGDFTQAIMELGALICLPNTAPLCAACPLSAFCKAYLKGNPEDFPHKPEKPARTRQVFTVFLLRAGDNIAVRRRPGNGLLAGMWEFPNTEGNLTPAQAAEWLTERGFCTCTLRPAGTRKHIFTHVEWEMHAYRAEGTGGDFCWVTPKQLAEEIALPAAFGKWAAAE